MGLSLPPCPCARVVGRSCCRFCSFRFPSQPYSRWSKRRDPFSPESSRPSSGSYCLLPTMWCLLWLASSSLNWSYTRNENHFPHSCRFDRSFAGLWSLPGVGCGSHRADDGRRSAHLLLSRAVRLDCGALVLREFRCVHRLLVEAE